MTLLIDTAIRDYNKKFMSLICRLRRKDRFDVDIDSLYKKVVTAKMTCEDSIIRTTGPYLYKYRGVIEEGQFLDYEFEELHNLPEKWAFVHNIVDKIRNIYCGAPADERDQVLADVKCLLIFYENFISYSATQ